MNRNYGTRVLSEDYEVSNDTKLTGLNNNDLIIGAAGSGKTGGYVIPNLQRTTHSMIVSDTKRNLYSMFRDDLEKRGFDVRVIDFVEPELSYGYNPLDYIRRNKDGSFREQDIAVISRAIMPVMDVNEPFWEMAARTYISFLIAYVLETCESYDYNLSKVMEKHTSYCRRSTRLEFEVYAKRNPDTLAARMYNRIAATESADKMWASIMEFATQALTPFDYREMRRIFKRPERLDIASLGKTKTVLFINQSDTDQSFATVVNLFLTQVFQILCAEADRQPDNRLRIPVRVVLDDFATGAVIPDFDKLVSVIRSRDVYVSIILQSISQLDSLYGSGSKGFSISKTIVNNCDTILFLGGQDEATEHFVAKKCLKTEDTIHTKPVEKAYLMVAGMPGRLTNKIKPYSTLGERYSHETEVKENGYYFT